MATVKENLIAAKAMIDAPEKWHRGSMRSGKCLCAMGAIADVVRVTQKGFWVSQTPEYLEVRAKLPAGFNHVPAFNDHPDTTHADIMALFDRAIASVEASTRMEAAE